MRHFMVIALIACLALVSRPAFAQGVRYSRTTTTTSATTETGGPGRYDTGRGRDALDNAEAQSLRERTRERYDDRYFNADRVRQDEARRATGPDYTGPSAADRASALHYGVVGTGNGETSNVPSRHRVDAFETPDDMDSP